MSDYSAVAPPQNFSQSSAFAAALQRARQIAAKINPTSAAATTGSGPTTESSGQKRPLEDAQEPESKKVASGTGALPTGGDSSGSGASAGGAGSSSAAAAAAAQAAAVAARVAAAAAAGIQGLGVPGLQIAGGPVTNEDIKVPDKMVGLIIGRGGEQISRLQSESGCKIQMAPDSGGLPERLCTLTGNAQAISRAKELIGAIVAQRSRTEGTGGARLDEMGLVGGPVSGGNTPGGPTGGNNSGGGGTGGVGVNSLSHVEIMVPGPKVGLIIGKGGETIKQLQEKSGAKMVVIQDGPSQENEKPLRITGDPQKVEHAKALVYELIAEKEMQRRDNDSGRGRGGRPGFDRMGGNNGGRDFDRNRNWDNNGPRGDRGDKAESTFTVPAAKCGVIIGRGGETIKQINQQTGAHCELDRRPQSNPAEKVFIIRGNPDQIEQAKRLIAEKLGMAGGTNGGPPAQFPMGGVPGGPGGPGPQQHFAPQNWGAGPAGFQQGPWANPQGPHPNDPMFAAQNNQIQVNPQTGQPDYSAQWAEYYRSVGMHREAELIEQQAKANKAMVGGPGGAVQPTQGAQPGVPVTAAQGQPGVGATQNGQPDYSAQWAEYYRSIGKIKEAEVIEAQMKSKQAAAAVAGAGAGGPAPGGGGGGPNAAPGGPQPGGGPNPYTQPQYGYQAAGFYGATPQPPTQPGQPQYPAPAGYPNYPGYHPNAAQNENQ